MADQDGEDRTYPERPVVGVGAVVVRDGQVLIVKRGHEPGKGKWSIPGGRLELGETVHEGVKREVLEECSIDIQIEKLLDVAENIVRDDDGRVLYHYVLIDVLAEYAGGETRAQSDADECRWVSTAELKEMDITTNLRSMLKKAGII